MSKKTAPSPPPSAAAPSDARDAAIAALQTDQGPAVLTVAVNMVTGRVTISGIMRTDAELRALRAALAQAQDELAQRLEAAAEARGRAANQPAKE